MHKRLQWSLMSPGDRPGSGIAQAIVCVLALTAGEAIAGDPKQDRENAALTALGELYLTEGDGIFSGRFDAICTGAEYVWKDGYPYVSRLSVFGSGRMERVLEPAQSLSELRTVSLLAMQQIDAPDRMMADLAKLKQLETLALTGGFKFGRHSIATLADAPKLRELRFGEGEIPEDALLSDKWPAISSLTFTCPLSGPSLRRIARLPGLSSLALHNTGLNAAELTALREAKALRTLAVGPIKTAEELDVIAGLSSLTSVSLYPDDSLRDTLAPRLARLSEVRHVDIGPYPIGDQDIAAIARLPKLERLGVLVPAGAAVAPIYECDKLTELELVVDDQGQISLRGLGKLTRLKRLSLNSETLTRDDAQEIAGLSRLESLHLHGVQFEPGAFQLLKTLGSLESLVISGSNVSDSDLAILSSFRKLKKLSLNQTEITDAAFETIALPQSLETLAIARTKVGNKAAKAIGKLHALRELDIRGTMIDNHGAAALQSCPSLTVIQANRTAITDAGLRRLAQIKHIRIVDVGETKCTLEEARRVHRGRGALWVSVDP